MEGCKACKQCRRFLSFDLFWKHNETRDRFSNICKDCDRDKHRQWRAENPDKSTARGRRFRKNNPLSHRKSAKSWKDRNKARHALHMANYRASKKLACPPWAKTDEVKAQIESHYEHALWLSKVTDSKFHVDHIVPLNNDFVCGLHVPCNLMVLEASDNLVKNNHWWPGQLPCQAGKGKDHEWWKELKARVDC